MIQKIHELADNGLTSSNIVDKLNILDTDTLYTLVKDYPNLKLKILKNTRDHTNENLHISNKQKRENWLEKMVYFEQIKMDIINTNMGYTELSKKYIVGIKDVCRVSELSGLNDKLKNNNQIYKRYNIIKICSDKRKKRINDVVCAYGDIISNMVSDGFCIKRLKNIIPNISNELLLDVVCFLGLRDKLAENSKIAHKLASINNFKLATQKIKGTKYRRYKPTQEMEEYYKQLLYNGVKDGPAKNMFHEKFRKSDGMWPELQNKFGYLEKNPCKFLSGKLNIMYGKQPDQKAGIGIKGHIYAYGEKIMFRSSLELLIFIHLIRNNIVFCLSKHVVKFIEGSKTRNYFPDIVINDIIYEIKPSNLLNLKQVEIKYNALMDYCDKHKLKCGFITEKTYDLSYIKLDMILEYVESGLIMINDVELNRLKRNIK